MSKPLQRIHVFLFGALFLLTMGMMSCKKDLTMSDYVKTTQSGINTLPWPRQLEALFGDGDHLITDFGVGSGPRIWTPEVFFYGRYSLAAQFDVKIDYQQCRVVTNTSAPKFYLYEVESLTRDASGINGANIAHQGTFDEEKWAALLRAKGDWSAIGIPVKTNDPINGFDEYVKRNRESRVRIPH
jgi:hypothetical protein